jgi:hypothetical protein
VDSSGEYNGLLDDEVHWS